MLVCSRAAWRLGRWSKLSFCLKNTQKCSNKRIINLMASSLDLILSSFYIRNVTLSLCVTLHQFKQNGNKNGLSIDNNKVLIFDILPFLLWAGESIYMHLYIYASIRIRYQWLYWLNFQNYIINIIYVYNN